MHTSVLLYSISTDPAEATKRDRAARLLSHPGGALSAQVLQEFYVNATRENKPQPLSHDQAVGLVIARTRFAVQNTTPELVMAAFEIKAAFGFSYWDSAIIAAARALQCHTLYSEDMTHGQMVAGVRITNPFL